MMLQFRFSRNYSSITDTTMRLPTLQCVSRNPNEILLSKDAVADYANTLEVTFSIRDSRKLYQDTRERLATI